ncbi:division/cell wall cluster transcriptional repressor MraZ [Rhodovibrionaceae bacterium A322]
MQKQPPFLGTFHNKVDRKGRVSVPAAFRQILGASSFPGLVLYESYKAPGAIEGCSMDFMTDLSESLMSMDLYSETHEDLSATLFSESHQLSWDANGRIVLPEELIEAAGITDMATFAGMGKSFRIWEPAAFKVFQAARRAQTREKGLSLPLRPKPEA